MISLVIAIFALIIGASFLWNFFIGKVLIIFLVAMAIFSYLYNCKK